eukprot:15365823-Ditylum_brightwellii.AAC.1
MHMIGTNKCRYGKQQTYFQDACITAIRNVCNDIVIDDSFEMVLEARQFGPDVLIRDPDCS